MIYKKFTIEYFRSFSEQQTLQLAAPIEGQLGSGITYIVGGNNAGKTTIIEGLWMKKDQYLNDSEKKNRPPEFKFYSIDDDLIRTVKLLRPNAYRFAEDPDRNIHTIESLFEIVSSRRHWTSVASGENNSTDIVAGSSVSANPRTQDSNINIAIFLKAIEKDSSRYEAFTNLVKRIIPDFSQWAVGFEGKPYIKYISSEGIGHKSDFLGDGVISIIRILAHLFEERPTGLIIDEPELSLHPTAQKKLIKLIAEFAQKRQIVVSTHSPYFIRWEYIKNGAILNRVAKTGDTSSKIYTLKNTTEYLSLITGANWQQPFLMDEVAKEIFFANDNILFLEGQEDIGLLRGEFEDTDVTLFGYGVRGFTNFKGAMKMAQDLGFQRIGTILDQGANESIVFKDLTRIFPKYKVLQWDKNDIRDKKESLIPAKEGYFTQKGIKKKSSNLGDFNEKIQLLKDYFCCT